MRYGARVARQIQLRGLGRHPADPYGTATGDARGRLKSEAQTEAAFSGVRYFFFAGELAVFGAVVQDRSAAGDGTFFGCLGFFASRLPRN
jgi:hypothetical protein